MKPRWAARLPSHRFRRLGALRLAAEIEHLAVGEIDWIRGHDEIEEHDLALRSIADLERFLLDDDGLLYACPGPVTSANGRAARVPGARLPEGTWVPLPDAIEIRTRPPALPGQSPPPVRLHLAPCAAAETPNALLTDGRTLRAWVERAAKARLDVLEFAADRLGRALVRGRPLPPIPGVRLVERRGVATRAGTIWHPTIDPATLAKRLGVTPGGLALLDGESLEVELLDASCFVRATRSAVRLSFPAPDEPGEPAP